MIYRVTKEFIGYPIGKEIDLDKLAETNYSEYVHISRKIQEGGCLELVSVNKSIDEKEINKIEIGEDK